MTIQEIKDLIAKGNGRNAAIQITNIINKNISDFTEEDTVYLVSGASDFPVKYLCQFIKFESGVVYGKALQSMVNPDLYKHDIDRGLIIKSRKASLFGKLPSDEHSFYHHLNSIGRFYDELLESPEDAMNIKNHESYGMIGLSRGHISGGVSLFGSSIKHSEVITLKISKGEVNRSYNRDSFSSRAEIIEIDLSQSQFSELITSFNRGDGTPCTLKTVNGKRMEEPPFVSKVQQSQIEFQNRMSNLEVRMENLVSNVKEILEKKSITKGDREIIQDGISSLNREIKSNVPFISDQFAQQMDKTISEAKAEIEQFTNRALENKGLEPLSFKQMLDK